MGDAHVDIRLVPGQGMGGAVQHRLGELDPGRHVGQLVLDRLEAADRLAELLALGHVVDRQIEHALRQPYQLPGHRQRAPVQGLRPQHSAHASTGDARLGAWRPLHVVQTTRDIDAAIGLQLHLIRAQRMDFVVMRQQQQVGHVRVGHPGVDRVADGHADTPRGDLRQPVIALPAGRQAAEQARSEVGGIAQRIRNGVVAQLLGHQRPGHVIHAQATAGFRHGQRGQALFGNLAAQIRAAACIGFPDFTEHLRRRLGHQKAADGAAKRQLIFGKGEVHRPLLTSAGRACARR